MSVLLAPNMTAPKPVSGIREDMYLRAIYWVIRERAGGGGWPPREVSRVKGWMPVRMIAAIHEISPAVVAADLIEHYDVQRDCGQWP